MDESPRARDSLLTSQASFIKSKEVGDGEVTISNLVHEDNSEVSGRDAASPESAAPTKAKRGLHFWLVIVAICVSGFLSALEYVSDFRVASDLPRADRRICRRRFRPLCPRSYTTLMAKTSCG